MIYRFKTYLKSFILTITFLFIALQIPAFAAQVTLNWDQNDPVPSGYRIFQRTENQSYDYDNPAWDGTGSSTTITNLADNTTYYFVIRAYNSCGNESSDSQEISHSTTVIVNHAPVLNSIGSKTVNESDTLQFTISASDQDNDTLSYQAGSLPTGAAFNASTRTFSWTPGYNATGNYNVVFTVTDNGSPAMSDSETIAITVGNVNRPPVLSSIGPKNTLENQTLQFQVSGTDPDGDTVSYTAGSLPSGASFNTSDGSFSWTPGFNATGNYTIIFNVLDNGSPSLSDSESVTITVGDVNRPPVLNPIGAKTVNESDTLEFSISASDQDNDTLSYQAGNLPTGASFNQSTRTFSWTPGFSATGNYDVNFTVSDNGSPSLSDSETITITVGNVNRPPVLNPIGAKTVNENQTLEITLSGNDADGDILSFSAGDLPTGAQLNENTGVFNWTPDYNQTGNYQVIFTVSDSGSPQQSDSETVTLTVGDVNRPPVLDTIGSKNILENQTLTFTIHATDPDGDALTYSASNLPSGAVFNSETGIFSWTPGYTGTGNYNIRFTVSDNGSPVLTAHEEVAVTVGNINRPPVISSSGSKTVKNNEQLTFTLQATDPDGDSITYSSDNLPGDATLNPITGLFSWLPTTNDAGNYIIVFNATDSGSPSLSDSLEVIISVGKTNRPPKMNTYTYVYKYFFKPGPKVSALSSDNQALKFKLEASDPDGHTLTYTASGLPSGAAVDPETGDFNWIPGYEDIGTHHITFTVTDNGSPAESDSEEITIIVELDADVSDRDGDLVDDIDDAFPDNPDEWEDTDNDGIGNNEDSDDDNDGMSDAWELQYGLDPLYDDSGDDPDHDGKTNLEEYNDNSDPSENTEPIQFVIRNLINNSTENGGSAKYSIRLPYKPLSNVSVWLESLDTSEGTVWPQKLTFTPDNWNSVGHTMTARGVDDHEADGKQPYKIRLAKILVNNAQINQTDYQEITVMNIDNDSPGVTVGELEGQLSESGDMAVFDVYLNYRPDSDVTISLQTDGTEASLSPASLVFTPDNWNTSQEVTVTGLDDSLEDGNRQFDITLTASSGDTGYDQITIDKVTALNIDNDTPGITVSGPDWNSVENGDHAEFTVKLNRQPDGDVVFAVESSNENEGQVSQSFITFTSENWNTEQTITVTGVDDQVADGDQEFMISLTVDSGLTADSTGYRLIEPASVTITNEDNDITGGTIGKDVNNPIDERVSSSSADVGGCFIGSLSLF